MTDGTVALNVAAGTLSKADQKQQTRHTSGLAIGFNQPVHFGDTLDIDGTVTDFYSK